MPGIGLGKPKTHSPNLSLNPGHPLATGLMFHISPNSSQGRAGGPNIFFAQGLYGHAIYSAGASAWAVKIPKLKTFDNWTMHSVLRISSTVNYAVLFCIPANPQNAGWVSPWHACSMGREISTDDTFLGTNNSGSYTSTVVPATITYTDNQWHSWTGSWGRAGGIVYKDGIEQGSTATTSNAGLQTTPTITGTPEYNFCGRSASVPDAEYIVGHGVLAALWDRRLSPTEVTMMHENPFCMFGG